MPSVVDTTSLRHEHSFVRGHSGCFLFSSDSCVWYTELTQRRSVGVWRERTLTQVVGDSFAATTHSDLVIRARDLGVKVKTFYNASIMNAVAGCGLQLYRFGQAAGLCNPGPL